MSDYQEALQIWGANKINKEKTERKKLKYYPNHELSSPDDIEVKFNFDEGYACCGRTDPDCYCSFAESPRAEILIEDNSLHAAYQLAISIEDFDFSTILKEIVEAGGGTLTG